MSHTPITDLISPQAYVHPAAQLAEGVRIDPFAVVHEDTIIGPRTWIGSGAIIYPGARIGADCSIFSGASIASIPQDLKFRNEKTTAELGNRVIVREYATINRGTTHSQRTVVEDDVLIMAYAHIAHDCHLERRCIVVNAVNIAGHVIVGEHAVIGGMSAVHQFTKIGKHAFIAGGSMVRKDVPPYVLAGRDPISYVGINSTGLRRRGFTSEQIAEIQEIYRIIYLRGLNYRNAVQAVLSEFQPSVFRDDIVQFIQESERGIMRGYNFIDKGRGE